MFQSTSKTLLRTQSDARLATLAAAGNEVAFAAIVERHTRLLSAACRRVLPESRVEDAVQQAFVAAWAALRRGDEVRELRPWLLRIARNTALNALRVPGYDYDVLSDSLRASEAPPAELERREVIRATLTGLAALPESQREALLGSAVYGTPHAEIARELGVSEGAVRQLVLRARMTLRAAATAVVPWPAVKWLATVGQHGEPSAARVAELAAGAAPVGAGAAALLAKTGAVVVIAGGAAATPALVERTDRHRAPETRPAVVAPGAGSQPHGAVARGPRSAVAAPVALRHFGTGNEEDDDGRDRGHANSDELDRDDDRDGDRRAQRRSGERDVDDGDGDREMVLRKPASAADTDELDEPDERPGDAGPSTERDGPDPAARPAPAVAPAADATATPATPAVPEAAVVPSDSAQAETDAD